MIVRFKILFQELCKEKREWDQPITGQLLSRCYALIDDLMSNEPIIIERFVSAQQEPCELFGFCDASMVAYAAVVYLKDCKTGGCQDKSSPLQAQLVPRLELLAALLLSLLIESVIECARECECSNGVVVCHMLYRLTDSMALDQRRQVMKTFCSESGEGDSSAYCSAVVILITTNEVIMTPINPTR